LLRSLDDAVASWCLDCPARARRFFFSQLFSLSLNGENAVPVVHLLTESVATPLPFVERFSSLARALKFPTSLVSWPSLDLQI